MWSNLVSFPGSSSSTLRQVPPTNSDKAKEIRGIVEENLRELIPQYLKEPFKAAGDSSIATQPTAPRRLPEGPSNLPLLAKSGDGLSLKGGTIDRTQFSGDFTFKIPRLQETRDNRADRSLPLFTPEAAVESRGFGPKVTFPLQTPTHKLSRGNSSFTFRGRTTHNLDQSSVSQQSGRHHGPLEPPLLEDDRASSKVYPLTMAFEGSSPTLHIAANRSLRQPPVNPQRKFYAQGRSPNDVILSETSNNRFPRQSAGSGGSSLAGVADPFATEEAAPPLQPSRLIRRESSTKSLKNVQRRRDGG